MKTKQQRLDLITNMMKTNDKCRNHFTQCVNDNQWESLEWIVDNMYKPLPIRELDKLITKLEQKFV